jgi:hypothetical protein
MQQAFLAARPADVHVDTSLEPITMEERFSLPIVQ